MMLAGLDKEGKACCFPSLQLHLLQSETYFSLEHCAKEMFYLLCLSLDDAEISQKVTTGKLLLMVVKEQTYLFTVYISSRGPFESFKAREQASYC